MAGEGVGEVLWVERKGDLESGPARLWRGGRVCGGFTGI